MESSTRSAKKEGSSRALVAHVFATCFVCAVEDAKNTHLDVSVYLSKHLPTYRLDLSDNGAILTQDDKKRAALQFTSDGEFFDLWRNAITGEKDRSTRVLWDREKFKGASLAPGRKVSELLESLNIDMTAHDGLEREVTCLVDNPFHRYR